MYTGYEEQQLYTFFQDNSSTVSIPTITDNLDSIAYVKQVLHLCVPAKSQFSVCAVLLVFVRLSSIN
jgi:hypothetical protein